LTADQTFKKLESTVLKNVVYVGHVQIFDGKDMKTGFSNKDLDDVKRLLRGQKTFFPSSKVKNYSLVPGQANPYQSQTMKKKIEEKLILMNKGLIAPKDAQAHLEQGKMIVTKSIDGKQYDVASLLKDYQKQEYNREIHLNSLFILPVKSDSPVVKQEKKMLQELLSRIVEYKVQDKVYSFKGSDVIKNASVSKDMKVTIDTAVIKNNIAEINQSQSTLGKNYTFKTHSGSVISVKGGTYGWAIDVDAETKRIEEAFEKGEKSILAYNVYGIGWSTYGVGYHNPTNNGIGDSYAEASIKEQQIWIYKNGQLKVTTHVVTGRHDTHEDTPTGVWYIEYKESPSTLKGSEVGNPNYSVKVDYWAPFTLDGVGFHDAKWRKNWASNAYLTKGSGGCVNTPANVMKSVYDNLSQNEPVVVY
jgi:hypothetical protein